MDRRGPWTVVIAVALVFLGILVIVGGAVALRVGPFARPPGTPTPFRSVAPSPTSTTLPTSLFTPDPSEQPSESEPPTQTAQPTEQPTDPPGGSPTPRASPSTPLGRLLSHVPEPVRGSCEQAELPDLVLAGVQCSAADGALFLRYFQYGSTEDMYATYNDNFHSAEIDADSGRCYDVNGSTITATPNKWPAEHAYSIREEPAGRYLCFEVPNGFDVYWTDERFHIIGIAQTSADNLDLLVNFWLNEAGPVP